MQPDVINQPGLGLVYGRLSPHVKKGLMDEWMDQWNGMIGMYTEKKREGDIDG
jgi:hypothetical protein